MTRTEHLLTILAEEAAELAQRATKALRFGLQEVEPGQDLKNFERLLGEYADVLAVVDMLTEDSALPAWPGLMGAIEAKFLKVEKYLEYSAKCGTLEKK